MQENLKNSEHHFLRVSLFECHFGLFLCNFGPKTQKRDFFGKVLLSLFTSDP